MRCTSNGLKEMNDKYIISGGKPGRVILGEGFGVGFARPTFFWVAFLLLTDLAS